MNAGLVIIAVLLSLLPVFVSCTSIYTNNALLELTQSEPVSG